MMRDAHDEVKKYYYDPKLQGLDWDARYKEYSQRIAAAHSFGEGFTVVAAFLAGLQDSHTYFVPPRRTSQFEPGYRLELIGDSCFVTRIRPETDAASKLHVGDQVLKMDGYDVNRGDLHNILYSFNLLMRRAVSDWTCSRRTGEPRQVVVTSTLTPRKLVLDATGEGSANDLSDLIREGENQDQVSRRNTTRSATP